jgi:hypothetical protein
MLKEYGVRKIQTGDVGQSATNLLGRQSRLPKSVPGAIVKLFEDPDKAVRVAAIISLTPQSTLPDTTHEAVVRLCIIQTKT